MGKLICVVGGTGVGKTTLVHALCNKGPFVPGLEEHTNRPFQRVFKTNHQYAFANQLDYMLLRAEQECYLRQSPETGLMDGGLEMDFFGFTHLFHARAWLTDHEFDLCRRFYKFVRTHQPPPEMVIHLTASPTVIAHRLATRRRINIVTAEDILPLDSFLCQWLCTLSPDHILHLDVSDNDNGYLRLLPSLLEKLLPFCK